MAKTKTVKKSRRRLKRSIRRSLAAVLMITAIGVAAVPVPENYAEDGSNPSVKAAADLHNMKEFKYESDPKNDVVLDASIDLNSKKGKTVEELLADSDVKTSYAITDIGGGLLNLSWQFMYYKAKDPSSGQPSGVICKYNKQFYSDETELALKPTAKYFTIEESHFNDYFAGTLNSGSSQFKNTMDNNPTAEVEFNYDTFLNDNQTAKNIKAYFEKYFKQAYDAKVAEFQAYKTAMENPSVIDKPAGPPKALTDIPSESLSGEQRLQYFCEHHKTLKSIGTGYTLRSVNDSRPDKPADSKGVVYVVNVTDGSEPLEPYTSDKAGFLVEEKTEFLMCAIGAGAFQDVTNVVNMTIPDQIGYIGDEAFANAALLESIKIGNTAHIGNRAFKDCVKLEKVDINQGTRQIGQECFSNTLISEIKLPVTIKEIGYGAFSNCGKLTTVDLNSIGQDCTIGDYAFYNCSELKDVSMADAKITSIGEGAFAAETGSQPMGFTLPRSMSGTKSIGNYMFAGRSGLQYVIFPKDLGRTVSKQASIPSEVFHGCINLKYVEFPNDPQNDPHACGFVDYTPGSYDEDGNIIAAGLFTDVINPDFYVKGPKLNTDAEAAYPRKSTWDAVTAVSKTVPYLYIENGSEFYEVSDGIYLQCINDAGILTSCVLKPGASLSGYNGRLDIPSTVGNTKVIGIAEGCFSDPKLNAAVTYLKIEDNSITSIADGVFQASADEKDQQWKKLEKVYIGNSVELIGKDAFKNCSALVDVTFSSPLAGHEAFKIGADAFKTGSDELTFHGDIAKGYAPFDWAMDPGNVIDSHKGEKSQGIRVCYKSMAPYYLTVMYNPITEMVTMVDYPKRDQMSKILSDVYADELAAYKADTYEEYREQYLYALYADSDYDGYRTDFAMAWQAAGTNEEKEALYHSDLYGPWINEQWVANQSSGGGTAPGGGTVSGGDGASAAGAFNWLFDPIIAYADDEVKLSPYYDVYEYDIMGNAEANDVYRPSTPEEDYLRTAVKNIEVPDGVESIDVYGYINNLNSDGSRYEGKETNTNNYRTYFRLRWDKETREMYTAIPQDENENTEIMPGLFSGYYVDYKNDSDSEKFKRGNDTIQSVKLNSVKYLPPYAFDSCENLLSVEIGDALMDIGTAPFRGCRSMQSITDNGKYKCENGIIYSQNADGSYMIEECLPGRGTKVGASIISVSDDPKLSEVSTIKPGAFEECDDITQVSFGSKGTAGLAQIPKDCFKNCDNLQTVELPKSVNDIDTGAFAGLNNLRLLTIYGKEVKISGTAFEDKDTQTTVRTYRDSAVVRYVKEYGQEYGLQIPREDSDDWLGEQWMVTFLGPDYKVLQDLKDKKDGNALENPQYVENGKSAIEPQAPVQDGWTFDKWVGTNGVEIDADIYEDTTFYAKGYSNDGMVGGKWVVEFYDSIGAAKIGPTQYIENGKDAIVPGPPVHTGYIFDKWSASATNIQGNTTIVAWYKPATVPNTSGNTTNTSNNTTNTSGNTTNNSNNTTNTSGNTTSSSKQSSSSTSSSSSTTSSSTASTSTTSSAAAAGLYTVTVIGGSGSGSYAAGTTVQITANTPAAGSVFSKWVTDSQGVSLASVSTTPTTFTMPSNNVTITAEYTTAATPSATPASTGGTSGGGNGGGGSATGNGTTRVDITKPGMSNKDLATANVNGSTDNFVVKITETDEATKAVVDALTGKYGSLENILYYAMDISLYDSTGTVKITDTSGLSVDITIPIPDALVAYGGNNMAGAVVNGNQLESLNENFTTINGIPCIRFTATHFSPYTVYVDTGNLTEGMLDTTPKTGDPIHPKWFLSLGLACLSIILFMKKDKKVKVKTA